MKNLIAIVCLISCVSVSAQFTNSVTIDRTDTHSAALNLTNTIGFWHLTGPRSYEQGNNFSIMWYGDNGYYERFLTISDNGNMGMATANPFASTNNLGFHIKKGMHSSLLLGDPTNGHGGIIQTSDGKQRVFIGANLYDDQTNAWSSFQPGKGSAGISILADEGSWGTMIDFITSTSDAHYRRSMRIFSNGYVGIGTDTEIPDMKLTVKGHVNVGGTGNGTIKARHLTGKSHTSAAYGDLYLQYHTTHPVRIGTTTNPAPVYIQGKVGIGTSSPDEQLTVDGTIHSEEVKVDLSVPGPDYVFEEDYDLRTLEETEAYIKANKHLPEIPSAKEMEANGVQLGEMNMLLLKKIEELTLYILEQEKRIKQLENSHK